MNDSRPARATAAPLAARETSSPAAELRAIVLNTTLYAKMKQQVGQIILANHWQGEALDLAFDPDPRVAFRVFWGLEYAYFQDPEAFGPHIPHFFDTFIKASNPSVMRHCVNILRGMIRRDGPLPEARREPVAEKCFDLLIDPGAKVAVKARAMDILLSLAPELPWVGEELEATVRVQMQGASPGLVNKGSKTLLALRKTGKK